jgi:hypothetical protein
MFLVIYFFRYAPSPKTFRTSQNSTASWGPSTQHMSLWGTFPMQTIPGSDNLCLDLALLVCSCLIDQAGQMAEPSKGAGKKRPPWEGPASPMTVCRAIYRF